MKLGYAIPLALLVVAASTSSNLAIAQTKEATAAALFDEGRSLMTAGKFVEACGKFEASLQLDLGIGTMLRLGDCYVKIDKPASAWALFKDAQAQAHAQKDGRESIAAQFVAELEPRVSWLYVSFAPRAKVSGEEILRDGIAIPASLLDARIPIDPGEHKIEARAPEKVSWSGTMSVKGDAQQVRIEIPALVDKPKPPPIVVSRSSGAVQRGVGVAIVALGAVSLGVGVYFGVSALDKQSTSESDPTKYCNAQDQCYPEGLKLREDARTFSTVADVTLGVGIATVVIGAALILFAPRSVDKRIAIGPSSLAFQF